MPDIATQPAPSTPSGRFVRKVLWKRLRISRHAVHAGLTAMKTAAAWRRVQQRRAALAGLPAPALEVPQRTGILRFAAGTLPGTEEALAICHERFARFGRETRSFNPRKAGFLRTVISGDDFAREPELVRFMISPPVVEAAAHYLGAAPVLAGAALWWSPPNQGLLASQRWHLDSEDGRQLKVFVNVSEVDEDQGPFTCLPADVSAEPARRMYHSHRRLDDEEVAPFLEGTLQRFTGPPGSGGFVDTARCLHYGSRGNRRDRLVLMFQFLRLEAPTESTFRVGRFPVLDGGLTPLQRLAISDG